MELLWRVELLGGLRGVAGLHEITRFQSRQTGYLLAYLAYFSHRAHPREELIEILWPECDPEMGRGRLNQAVYSLRRQLTLPGLRGTDLLQSDREMLRINRALCTTDVAAFEAELAAAKSGSTVERRVHLQEAVRLYGGELLPGCYAEWCLTEREVLTDRCVQALHQLASALLQEQDLDGALAASRRALTLDPLREESHRIVMRVFATAGQFSAALQQYAELERTLREQLRQRPSARAQELAEEIRQFQESGPRGAPVQPRPAPAQARSLPSGIVTLLAADLPPAPGTETAGGTPSLREYLRPILQGVEAYPLVARGDRARVVFARATDARRCALALRQALVAAGDRPRIALHTGETPAAPPTGDAPETRPEGHRTDPALAYAERLLLAGHAGQILVSESTAALLRDEPLVGTDESLTDLGLYRLRDPETVERVFQLGAAEERFPHLGAPGGFAGNLPRPAARLFGREPELTELETRLRPPAVEAASRLWNITGPGGTGKTRLAQEVATRMAPSYEGAVWYAAVEEVVTGEQLAGALREVLRLERVGATTTPALLSQALSRRPSLLVLDNFEQLDASGVGLLQELLDRTPGLTALVTSRRRLGIAGEREFPLSPLPVPEPSRDPERVRAAESVRLFLDRAQAVRPDFQITSHNAAAVAELCRHLEGIPLALELAAARTQVLTPAQMLSQLEQRFRFLATSRPNVGPRHRSMQTALDWGYSLLSPPLRALYARLSLFRGGWALEAIDGASLLGDHAARDPLDPVEALTELRESSLVLAEETDEGMRFRMLEMIRQHAATKLVEQGDETTWRERHRDWYLAFAEAAEPELRGAEQARWLTRLDAERENLRAALEWSLAQEDGEAALRMAIALCRFWEVRGYLTEGRRFLAAALQRAGDIDPLVRARALNRAGILAREQGDLSQAQALASECLEIYRALGDTRGVAYLLNNLGTLARQARDYPGALELYGASLELQRLRGDEAAAAVLLNNLGCVAQDQGDYDLARGYHQQSLDLQLRLDDPGGVALSLNNLADVARWSGDATEAAALAQRSLARFREVGDPLGAAASLHILGEAALLRGEDTDAARALRESLELFRAAVDPEGIADCAEAIAAAGAGRHPAEAATLLDATGALRQDRGLVRPPNAQELHVEREGRVRRPVPEGGPSRGEAPHSWDQLAAQALELTDRILSGSS